MFILHDLDETPMPKVALALDVSLNTAHSRLRHARVAVEKCLRAQGNRSSVTGGAWARRVESGSARKPRCSSHPEPGQAVDSGVAEVLRGPNLAPADRWNRAPFQGKASQPRLTVR